MRPVLRSIPGSYRALDACAKSRFRVGIATPSWANSHVEHRLSGGSTLTISGTKTKEGPRVSARTWIGTVENLSTLEELFNTLQHLVKPDDIGA